MEKDYREMFLKKLMENFSKLSWTFIHVEDSVEGSIGQFKTNIGRSHIVRVTAQSINGAESRSLSVINMETNKDHFIDANTDPRVAQLYSKLLETRVNEEISKFWHDALEGLRKEFDYSEES